ncbi:hypothetical protein MPSEU_000697600 [Mayamaea pseudoterrestris]|nr:hypothetical protein MPSEU_000697600 [Mayamaea pseudoterrestris]
MSSEETYLEAFMETLSTLPHQVRRNMDLLRDLDSSCTVDSERMRYLHQEYIKQAEAKVLDLEIVYQQPNGETGVRTLNGEEIIMPTTLEMMDYTYDEDMYREIKHLQEETMQKSDEKVSVAQQAYEMVDVTVQRLERDLEAMEKLLQSNGGFQTKVVGQINELAACQPTPGSEWILSKILGFDTATGLYTVADEDTESNKVFQLPEEQVILSGQIDSLKKGDTIYAVYPETTSFYQATVVQAPRKTAAASNNALVTVHFFDDADEHGVTHEKQVLLKHVIYPP